MESLRVWLHLLEALDKATLSRLSYSYYVPRAYMGL